jgi:hypothetical protein
MTFGVLNWLEAPGELGDNVGGVVSVEVGSVITGPDGLTEPPGGIVVLFSPVVGVGVRPLSVIVVAAPSTGGTEIGTPALEHAVITTLETEDWSCSLHDCSTQGLTSETSADWRQWQAKSVREGQPSLDMALRKHCREQEGKSGRSWAKIMLALRSSVAAT